MKKGRPPPSLKCYTKHDLNISNAVAVAQAKAQWEASQMKLQKCNKLTEFCAIILASRSVHVFSDCVALSQIKDRRHLTTVFMLGDLWALAEAYLEAQAKMKESA
jgi:hypothetical protein